MFACNTAFIDLAAKIDDVLGSIFLQVPIGDKSRLTSMANYLMQLMTNALESLTWVNTKSYF